MTEHERTLLWFTAIAGVYLMLIGIWVGIGGVDWEIFNEGLSIDLRRLLSRGTFLIILLALQDRITGGEWGEKISENSWASAAVYVAVVLALCFGN